MSIIDPRIQPAGQSLGSEVQWLSKQSMSIEQPVAQNMKRAYNSKSNGHQVGYRHVDFHQIKGYPSSNKRRGNFVQDASPVSQVRDNSANSVGSRSAGRKTFSNMKNQSQISIGHVQNVDQSPNLER